MYIIELAAAFVVQVDAPGLNPGIRHRHFPSTLVEFARFGTSRAPAAIRPCVPSALIAGFPSSQLSTGDFAGAVHWAIARGLGEFEGSHLPQCTPARFWLQ